MTPRTVACQALLSVGFSRQEYWSGLLFPSPGDLPNTGIEPRSPVLQAHSLTTELWGKPFCVCVCVCVCVYFTCRYIHTHTYGLPWWLSSVHFSSVTQSCLTLCDPMNRSTPGLPVHQQLPEFTQTHIHRVSDAIQPSHPLSSPSPPAPNPSQHQSLFQWVNSSHEVAKVLEFQL